MTIPGRMQTERTKSHGMVVVDYAHNKASMMALMSFMQNEFDNPKIIVVVGAPGDKGVSRRPGFSESLTAYADKAFLTTDDPALKILSQSPKKLIQVLTTLSVTLLLKLDRKKLSMMPSQLAGPDDVVLICGKGADAFQKIRGVNTPYPSDIVVAQNVINELEGQKEHFRK